jgi:UDP-N-acetylglucosamine 2-epimerase (non-hydrolysing)
MRKIAVFTGTRAEYGLLARLMRLLRDDPDITLQVIAGGTHFSDRHGATGKEILADGFEIAARAGGLPDTDDSLGVARATGQATQDIAAALADLRPDMLVLLGDRFEALAAAQAALILRIPVAHLHGGEITEGAYDDAIRHAITKMATWHFAAAEPYRQRIIQMGTPAERVWTVGAMGLDGLGEPAMPLSEVSAQIGFDLRPPFFLATYHPVTNATESAEGLEEMLAAFDTVPETQVLLTYPNADNGGQAIIDRIEAWIATRRDRAAAVPSLGFARYRAVLGQASAVVGNSSSGIIEAPSLHVPTVNIGDRQKGRLCAESVLHVPPQRQAILAALHTALSEEGRALARSAVNPYGHGNAAQQVYQTLRAQPIPRDLPFHDLRGPND